MKLIIAIFVMAVCATSCTLTEEQQADLNAIVSAEVTRVMTETNYEYYLRVLVPAYGEAVSLTSSSHMRNEDGVRYELMEIYFPDGRQVVLRKDPLLPVNVVINEVVYIAYANG